MLSIEFYISGTSNKYFYLITLKWISIDKPVLRSLRSELIWMIKHLLSRPVDYSSVSHSLPCKIWKPSIGHKIEKWMLKH